jgi:hypothetical protein
MNEWIGLIDRRGEEAEVDAPGTHRLVNNKLIHYRTSKDRKTVTKEPQPLAGLKKTTRDGLKASSNRIRGRGDGNPAFANFDFVI